MTSAKPFYKSGIRVYFLILLSSAIFQNDLAYSATRRPNQAGGAPNRGNAPSSNPFMGGGNAPTAAGKDQFYDDMEDEGDEEFDELNDEVLRQKMVERLRQRAEGNLPPPDSNTGYDRRENRESRSSGGGLGRPSSGTVDIKTGTANGTMIPSSRGPGCLRLDPDTGLGPDIVTNFDFPDADIIEIAKTLGKLTCLNFILDKEVRGKISIVSNSPISIGDAWKAFLTALDVNQLTLIPSGKYLRIAKQRDARDKQLKIYSGAYAPDNDAMITRVLPLKFINAEEVRRVFSQLIPQSTRMLAYEQTNTLILTDTAANIKKLVELVSLLDVEGYDEKLEMIAIKYASAEEIAKLIDQLLPGQTTGMPGIPPSPGGGRFGRSFTQRKTKEGGVISHIIADARTNSLIVSANSKGFDQVKALVKKLDSKNTASTGSNRIHVKYLQFADAEQVSNTLNSLASGAGSAPRAAVPGAAGGPPSAAVLFEGAVKVAPDKATNSLVVTASNTDYQVLKRVIQKLDVARDQVYVEAIIMEITLDKSFNLSTSIASPTNGVGWVPDGKLQSFFLNPLTGVTGMALGFKQGKEYSFTPAAGGAPIKLNTIMGLISALQSNTATNVLATPQILTLDNQEASIEIGDSVPVPTTSQIPNGVSQTSFTRQNVSLNLTIKPQINKVSSFVKLDINQKMEDFSDKVPKGLADQTFGTTSRSSKTTVVVQDQDTVALGGLIRDKSSETTTKVPILGDIPVLGWLFRSKSTTSQKTNLIAFITPRIIKQYQTARNILDKKFKERDDFLEENAGGHDPYQQQKLKMIKELPALSDLKNLPKIENDEDDAYMPQAEEDPAELSAEEAHTNRGLPSAYKRDSLLIPPSLKDVPPSGTPNMAGTDSSQQHASPPQPAQPTYDTSNSVLTSPPPAEGSP